MKKVLMILCASLLGVGCATTTKKELHPDLTMNNVEKKCDPDEFWRVQVLTTPSVVVRFPKCMKYESLLVVSVPNTADTKKIRHLVSELFGTMGLEFTRGKDVQGFDWRRDRHRY